MLKLKLKEKKIEGVTIYSFLIKLYWSHKHTTLRQLSSLTWIDEENPIPEKSDAPKKYA